MKRLTKRTQLSLAKKRLRPNPIFVEVIVVGDRGTANKLKPYVDAAHHAVMQLAINEGVLCGAIGRRAIVSPSALSRRMHKHGFYGKAK